MSEREFHTGHGVHAWAGHDGKPWSLESLTDCCAVCDCTPDCPAHELAENEAAAGYGAQVAALREALKEAASVLGDYDELQFAQNDALAALNDTAQAAAGYGLVEPWREVLWGTRVREMNYDGSPCWCPIDPMGEVGHDKHCLKARALLDAEKGGTYEPTL